MGKRSWPVGAFIGFLGLAIALSLSTPLSQAAPKEDKKMLHLVVHINFSEAERQGHGLKNVENILKDVYDDAAVEVVCHGAGINLLMKDKTSHASQIEKLRKKGRGTRRQGADQFHRPGLEDDATEQQGLGLPRQRPNQRGRDLPEYRGLLGDGGGQR